MVNFYMDKVTTILFLKVLPPLRLALAYIVQTSSSLSKKLLPFLIPLVTNTLLDGRIAGNDIVRHLSDLGWSDAFSRRPVRSSSAQRVITRTIEPPGC